MITDLQSLYDYCEGVEHPLKCILEITPHCNFRCPHCYISGREKSPEMRLTELCGIVDRLADNGVCALTITGGEPLTHPEFVPFYRYAKERGFLIALLTNGSLITDEHLQLFSEYPPFSIEISLYGSSRESYISVAKEDAFPSVKMAIERLLSSQVRIVLKTVVGTFNVNDLESLVRFSSSYGQELKYDFEIYPRIDAGKSPLHFRLPPNLVNSIQSTHLDRRSIIESREKARRRYQDKGIHCSSGLSVFLIGSSGEIGLCNWKRSTTRFLDVTFDEAWRLVKDLRIELAQLARDSQCSSCVHRGYCNWCPAYALLEHGNGTNPIEWHCELADIRSSELFEALSGRSEAQRLRLDRACHDLNRLLDEPGP